MTPPAATASSESPVTVSPRSRPSWFRRHKFATFILSLVAFTVLLRFMWGWYCARQLAAEWDKIRAQGHPTALADLAVGPLPDAENAWVLYGEAVVALMNSGVDSPASGYLEYPTYPPYSAEWETLAAASEKANAAVFPLARRARALPRLQFLQHTDATIAYSPEWDTSASLANTLTDGARYAHLRGDHAEAVERILDALHLARSLRQDDALFSQLMASGVDTGAAYAAQQIVPSLNLGSAGGGAGKPASPAQAHALIRALLDEGDAHKGLVRTLRRERVVTLDALPTLTEDARVLRPLGDRTAVRWLRDFDVLIRAAEAASGPQALAVIKPFADGDPDESLARSRLVLASEKHPRYSRWFEHRTPRGLHDSIKQLHRLSAERRATAMVVAARMYQQDHGRWPDDAAALVPKYLDALPADPFRHDGGPMRYVVQRGVLPRGGDRPLVYFEAGPDLDELIDPEPMYGWQLDWGSLSARARSGDVRQYRDASLWLPTTRRFDEGRKLAAEAVDHDPNEPDAPRGDAKDDD